MQLFSSVYSAGSCGRQYRPSGEKENPPPLEVSSRHSPSAVKTIRFIQGLIASPFLRNSRIAYFNCYIIARFPGNV